MRERIFVQPRSKHEEYTCWVVKTPFTEFVFTYNSKTRLFTGERTGDNEYSNFGNDEAKRVIDELNLLLVGWPE